MVTLHRADAGTGSALARLPLSKKGFETPSTVTIHLGLHKTASTFLQRVLFPFYGGLLGYRSIRTHAPRFLTHVLHCNDLEWDPATAASLLRDELSFPDRRHGGRMVLSDEQFCGSPFDNALSRRQSFDRLDQLFPDAHYFMVFRNPRDMIRSLYLQYIKTGGSATPGEFLTHRRHPLAFAMKAYLNYDAYLAYILSKVGKERIACFLYEDMLREPVSFCKGLCDYLQVEPSGELDRLVRRRANKSISPFWARVMVHANKLCRSERQPFLLLPRCAHRAVFSMAVRLSFSQRKDIIPEGLLADFCRELPDNSLLAGLVGRDLSEISY